MVVLSSYLVIASFPFAYWGDNIGWFALLTCLMDDIAFQIVSLSLSLRILDTRQTWRMVWDEDGFQSSHPFLLCRRMRLSSSSFGVLGQRSPCPARVHFEPSHRALGRRRGSQSLSAFLNKWHTSYCVVVCVGPFWEPSERRSLQVPSPSIISILFFVLRRCKSSHILTWPSEKNVDYALAKIRGHSVHCSHTREKQYMASLFE